MKHRTPVVAEGPIISPEQKQSLIINELIGWVNGRYINEIILEVAKKIKDGPTVEAIAEELKNSALVVEDLKQEYFGLGGKDQSFEVPDSRKVQILEREILDRAQGEYVLELRSRAAERVGNKELASKTATQLANVIGYLDGFKKELKRVKAKLPGRETSAPSNRPN